MPHIFNITASTVKSHSDRNIKLRKLLPTEFKIPVIYDPRNHDAKTKKNGPAFLSGPYLSNTRSGNPESCNLLTFDFDNDCTVKQMLKLRKRLKNAGIEFISHTTASHCPYPDPEKELTKPEKANKTKDGYIAYRLIIPLAESVPSTEYSNIIKAFAHNYGFDSWLDMTTTASPAGLFYLPLVYGDPETDYTTHLYPSDYNCAYNKNGTPFDASTLDLTLEQTELEEGIDSAFSDYFELEKNHKKLPVPTGINETVFVSALLDHVPPAVKNDAGEWEPVHYDEWFQVGAALHHQFEGKPEGLAIWENWAYFNGDNPDFDKDDYDNFGVKDSKKYRSFKRNTGSVVTLKSLAARKDKDEVQLVVKAYQSLLKDIEVIEEAEELIDFVRRDEFVQNRKDAREFAKSYREKYQVLNPGQFIESIGDITTSIADHDRITQVADSDIIDFVYDNFILHDDDKQVYDLTATVASLRLTQKGTILNRYTHRMPKINPRREDSKRHNIFDVCRHEQHGFKLLRTAAGETFEINGPPVKERNGNWYVNVYSKGNFPEYVEGEVPNRIQAVVNEVLETYFRHLAGSDEVNYKALRQFLGAKRQHPNRRPKWAMALLGDGGTGKSFYGNLTRVIIGHMHVNSIGQEVMADDNFNGFMSKKVLVTFIEEANDLNATISSKKSSNPARLKEVITQDTVTVNEKNAKAVEQQVFTNYIWLSNNLKALQSEDKDRRWLKVIVPAKTDKDHDKYFIKYGYMGMKGFFNEFAGLLEEYPQAFIEYFEKLDLNGFNYNSVPVNSAKDDAKSQDMSSVLGTYIDQFVTEQKYLDISESVIDVVALQKMLENIFELDDGDDVALSAWGWMKPTARRFFLSQALLLKGYVKLRNTNEKVRIPFERCEKVGSDTVFYHSDLVPKASKSHSSKRLSDVMIKEVKTYLEHRKILMMKGFIGKKPKNNVIQFKDV